MGKEDELNKPVKLLHPQSSGTVPGELLRQDPPGASASGPCRSSQPHTVTQRAPLSPGLGGALLSRPRTGPERRQPRTGLGFDLASHAGDFHVFFMLTLRSGNSGLDSTAVPHPAGKDAEGRAGYVRACVGRSPCEVPSSGPGSGTTRRPPSKGRSEQKRPQA